MTVTTEELKIIEDHARNAARVEARQRLHRYRNGAVIGFLILLGGIGYALHDTAQKSYDARGVLCKIIKSGDVQTYQYAQDGLINRAQLHRALSASAEYRKLLAPGRGCDTKITPQPKPAQHPTHEAPGAPAAPHR